MMYRYPHVIRLRGFWQRTALDDAQAPWRYCRRFGAPTGLDYHERVWLVCQGIAAPARVWLNGELIGGAEGALTDFEGEVTARLQSRNELCLEFAASAKIMAAPRSDDPARAVRLEIRTTLTPP